MGNNNIALLPPEFDPSLEALLPVLSGKVPLIVTVHRASDILTILHLADEFHVRIILSQATEGYKVAGEIAKRKVPVIVGPLTQPPGILEMAGARMDNAAILARRGVKLAFMTGSAHNVRNLPVEAGLAVAYGLPYDTALRALTLSPAEIFGIGRFIGSLTPGKDADLVIWEGDPLEPTTRVHKVFINGKEIPLKSHQTELFNQFK